MCCSLCTYVTVYAKTNHMSAKLFLQISAAFANKLPDLSLYIANLKSLARSAAEIRLFFTRCSTVEIVKMYVRAMFPYTTPFHVKRSNGRKSLAVTFEEGVNVRLFLREGLFKVSRVVLERL